MNPLSLLTWQLLPSERDSPETLRAKMGTVSGGSKGIAKVPLPKSGNKFGKADSHDSNPFGYSQEDEDHYWYVLGPPPPQLKKLKMLIFIIFPNQRCCFGWPKKLSLKNFFWSSAVWHEFLCCTCVFVSFCSSSCCCCYRALQDSADRLLASFEALGPEGGFLSTQKARDVLVKTGLTKDQLRQIWNLSDMDRDGLFDHDEYVVAMFLCDAVIQKGRPIPTELPASVVPPSKRALMGKAGH